MLCDLSFYRIIRLTQDISVFETISKLYLYLVMITDSYHIPVIGNNIVIYYSGFYVYILKLEGFVCLFTSTSIHITVFIAFKSERKRTLGEIMNHINSTYLVFNTISIFS